MTRLSRHIEFIALAGGVFCIAFMVTAVWGM